VGGLAIGVLNARAVGATNVPGLGGEIPGGIQRDEPGALHRAHLFQQTRLIEGVVQFIKQAEEVMGRDRVERLADVIVAGNLFDLKERPGVVASASLFHRALIAQERRALGEEHRKSRQSNVGHAIAGIVTGAPVRQSGGDGTQAFDEMIEDARVHASSNAGTGAKSTVTIV